MAESYLQRDSAMHVFDAISERRAVKHYDSSVSLTQEEETRLFELARQAPSSFNVQHTRFVVVKDPELRAKIREAAWDQAQITEASLLIIVCADVRAWDKDPQRYWATAPQAVQDFLVPAIGNFYRHDAALQRDEALRSVGLAAQTLMLAAKGMGYDSCPMIGCDIIKVSDIINLPEDYLLGMLIAVGKAIKPAQPKGGYIPYNESVIIDHF
jgi:nitroreductase